MIYDICYMKTLVQVILTNRAFFFYSNRSVYDRNPGIASLSVSVCVYALSVRCDALQSGHVSCKFSHVLTHEM